MSKTPGLIRPDEIYTIPEFRNRLGIGDYTMRQMRADGLAVVEISQRNRVVRGIDFCNWCEKKVANGNGA